MSGVEIVGFVLGGLPLLISAAEHYREGFEPLLKWYRFKTDFLGFINAIAIEKQLYDQTLERFLLSADVPSEELQLLMTKPDPERWRRQEDHLVHVLQQRLVQSYNVFMSTIGTMKELMLQLQAVLSLKNGGEVDWADTGASRWEYQMKRLRLSFSKRGPKILAAFETHNRKLRELLESNEKVEIIRASRKDTTWGSIFESIRKHASSLHSALKRSWCCDCTIPHSTDLQLQQRSTGGWTSEFVIAFEMQLDTQAGAPTHREFTIRLRPDQASSHGLHTRPLVGSFPETQYLKLGKLQESFAVKPKPEVDLTPQSTFVTSLSDTPSIMSLNGFMNKIAGSVSSESPPWHSHSKGISHAEKQLWSLGRKGKSRKSVRMNDAPPVLPPTPTVSQTPSPMPEAANTVAIVPGGDEIKDLCSLLHDFDAKSAFLGYFADEEQHLHDLVLNKKNIGLSNNTGYLTLETILRSGQAAFNRKQRHKIASVLASSFLQLQTTPWLAQTFKKQDVLFYKTESTVFLDRPFIRHSFTSTKCHSPSQEAKQTHSATRFLARDSLNNLGIILLEICYGQAIEDQPFRKQYLGADGTPHESTDYMTARDWVEIVGEQEPEWKPVIQSCISCTFEERANWSNKKFTTAVYESIVKPLEKLVMNWPE